MLLTRAEWADSNPASNRLYAPHRPWRCIGLSAESPLFLIDLAWGPQGEDHPVRSVLVPSPHELVGVVKEFGTGSCRVFRVRLANGNRDTQPALEEVTALRSYRAPDSPVKSYVFVDSRGGQHACVPWLPRPDKHSVWENELELAASLDGVRRESRKLERGADAASEGATAGA